MIRFNSMRSESEYRARSDDAAIHDYQRIQRECCRCHRPREMGELEVANKGPYTLFNPKRLSCKGGCNA